MLSPTERAVIALLRHDSPVSTHQIKDYLYGSRPDGGPDDADHAVRAVIYKARTKLARVGIEIETHGNGRGLQGRRIKPEHRDALAAILEDDR